MTSPVATKMLRTLILAGDTDASRDLRGRLQEWSAAGWVQPFLWVGDPRRDNGGLEIRSGEATPADFSAYLVGAFSGFRLVLVQLATDEDEDANFAARELARWAATEIRGRLGLGQVLKRISLVVPSVGTGQLPTDAVMQHWGADVWDVNVVAFPEDRPDPSVAFRPVRSGAGFAEFAALHVVTAGGLWSGCSVGPFDDMTQEEKPSVKTTRVFARIVRGGRLADAVLAQALPIPGSPKDPRHVAALVGGLPARQPDRIVDEMAIRTLTEASGGRLRFKLETPPQQETAAVKDGLPAIIEWLTYMVTNIPVKVAQRARGRLRSLSERASLWISRRFGDNPKDTDTVVRVFGDIHPSLLQSAIPSGVTDGRQLELEWDPSSIAFAEPELWRELRLITFGLLDGGELPESIPQPSVGSVREIITDPRKVAPEPTVVSETVGSFFAPLLPPDIEASDPIPLIDPARYREWTAWLDGVIEEAEVETGTEAAPTVIPSGPSTIQETGLPRAEGDSAQTVEASPITGVERLLTVRERLGEAVSSRSATFLWKVADLLDKEQVDQALIGERRVLLAEASAEAKREEFEETRDKDHRLGKWGRRIRFLLKAGVLMLIFLPFIFRAIMEAGTDLTLWRDALFGLLTGKFLAVALAVGGGIGLPILQFGSLSLIGTWFIELLREIGKDFKVEHARRDWEAEERFAREFRRDIEREKARLSDLYHRFVEWSEALAWMIHRPFSERVAPQILPSRNTFASPSRPLALRLGDGVVTPDQLRGLTDLVCREALGPGWISTAFEGFAKRWLDSKEWASLSNDQRAADLLDQSVDGSDVRDITRRIEDGSLGTAWISDLRETVRGRLAELGPDALFEHIDEVDGTGLEGEAKRTSTGISSTPRQFLTVRADKESSTRSGTRKPFIGGDDDAGVWTTDAYNADVSDIDKSLVWLPAPLLDLATSSEDVRLASPVIAPDGSCLFLSIQVDMTGPLPPSAYALFQPGEIDTKEEEEETGSGSDRPQYG